MELFCNYFFRLFIVYRNVIDFCMLFCILLFAKFIYYTNSFCVESSRFSTHKIIYSAKRDHFNSPFPIWRRFLFFLTALARTSSTMIDRHGESGHPCLISDLKGTNGFQSFTIDGMFAVGFPYVAFLTLR